MKMLVSKWKITLAILTIIMCVGWTTTSYSQAVLSVEPAELTEADLDGQKVTLKLIDQTWIKSERSIENALSVSGIEGVTFLKRYSKRYTEFVPDDPFCVGLCWGRDVTKYRWIEQVDRVDDTTVTIKLEFEGDFETDSMLTFTVDAAAIENYDGPALTAEIPVTSYKGVSASATPWLKETTLDGSVVSLTLTGVTYDQEISKIREALTVSGINGVTIDTASVQRLSDIEVNVELDYDGNIDVDTLLIFTVDAEAIVGYTGEAFTAGIPVTHVKELGQLTERELRLSIYWTDNSGYPIRRANFDGMDVEGLVSSGRVLSPSNIALDVGSGKMYWTDLKADKIQRANFDGTNIEDLLTGLDDPKDIALDIVGGKMYWIDSWTDSKRYRKTKIHRANLDGTNVEDLPPELDNPQRIALDVVGGKMYWMEYSRGRIQRANLDGTNIENLVGISRKFQGIALDVMGGKMYWIAENKIRRANLSGTNVEALLTGLDTPQGIALDVIGGKMYWTEEDKIRRANLDGTNVEDFLTELEGEPKSIALALPSTSSTPSVDLIIEAVSAEPATVAPGEKFRLYATLKNRGTAESTATTLRYYRSKDTVISTADTQLSRASRDPLTADGTIRRYLSVTAPTTPGTYYYGACVDSVTDESDTANNCSVAVSVTVTAPSEVSADVNEDGVVDVEDLVYVARRYGQTGTNTADVNGDSVVNIDDLILVAAMLDAETAAAPSLHPQSLERLTVSDVKLWLSQARERDLADPSVRKGILFLEQLLASMIPKETTLLPNYPNPFNPETWIPYQLAKPADVTLTIYAVDGQVVRRLSVGHQSAGMYQNRSHAAYWDGKNAFGESVASGVYFYTLTTGDFMATRKMLIRK